MSEIQFTEGHRVRCLRNGMELCVIMAPPGSPTMIVADTPSGWRSVEVAVIDFELIEEDDDDDEPVPSEAKFDEHGVKVYFRLQVKSLLNDEQRRALIPPFYQELPLSPVRWSNYGTSQYPTAESAEREAQFVKPDSSEWRIVEVTEKVVGSSKK